LNCFGIDLPVFHGEGVKDGVEWSEESGIELMWFVFEMFFEGFGVNFDKAVGYVEYFFFVSLKGLHGLDEFGVVVEEGLELVLLFL
jgi:hypothetical protein